MERPRRTPLGGAVIFYLCLLVVGFLYATYIKLTPGDKERISSMKQVANHTCRNDNIKFDKPPVKFDDMLLVVMFSKPVYNIIPLYETLYRPFYPNILYCGPTEAVEGSTGNLNVDMVFYSNKHTNFPAGSLNYQCVSLAWNKFSGYSRYLFVSDEVLIIPKTMDNQNGDKVWYWPAKSVYIAHYEDNTQCVNNTCKKLQLEMFLGSRNHTIQAMTEVWEMGKLEKNEERLGHKMGRPAGVCCNNLNTITGSCMRPLATWSHVYHIPHIHMVPVVKLLDVYLKHQVFSEIAISTVLSCVVAQSELLSIAMAPGMNFGQVYTEPKEEPWHWVTSDMASSHIPMFHHPHKLSLVNNRDSKHVAFYCKLLTFLHNPSRKYDFTIL